MILSGKRIRLLPFESSNWNIIAQWYYSGKYKNFFRHFPNILKQEHFEKYPALIGAESLFVLNKDKPEQVLGIINIIKDVKPNRAVYLGLLIDEQFQDKSLATEIFIVALDYIYNQLGYEKAIIEFLEKDVKLKGIVDSHKFLYEGKFHKECYMNGKFENELRYCMFKDFYNKHYRGKL